MEASCFSLRSTSSERERERESEREREKERERPPGLSRKTAGFEKQRGNFQTTEKVKQASKVNQIPDLWSQTINENQTATEYAEQIPSFRFVSRT